METKGIERRIKERMLTTRQPRLDCCESLPWTAVEASQRHEEQRENEQIKEELGCERKRERERAKAEGWGRRKTLLHRLQSPPSPSRRRETKKKKKGSKEREREAVREVRKKKKMENEWGGSVWFNVYRVGY